LELRNQTVIWAVLAFRMSNSPAQNLMFPNVLRVVVTVNDRFTGLPTDTTTVLTVSTNNAAFATAVVDPTDPRAILISAQPTTTEGGCSITIQETPTTPNPLSIPVFVTIPPDLSGVNFVSATLVT
jgi:hypothetical protein